MGEFDRVTRKSVCLCKIVQMSRFINENTKKNSQKAFLNEKFIHISLCIVLRSKSVSFSLRGDRHASDLKELQVNFRVYLSGRADQVYQTFCNNCSEYEKSVN